jgi:hypothetical protein
MTPGSNPARRLEEALQLHAGQERVLLFIDQFEEIFTLATDDADRDRFDERLDGWLSEHPESRLIVTVREEFHARLGRLTRLADRLRQPSADFSIRPLGRAELERAILRPAEAVNLRFDREVISCLVDEVLGQPAALPLLQFTLVALWGKRERNRITKKALETVGGPMTALSRAADGFYAGQSEENKAEIRRVLVALVRVDDLLEPYRQPVSRDTLYKAGSAQTEHVLQLLEKQDFIRVDGEVVEIKHEALIRNWPQLVNWIVQKRKSRASMLALSQAAKRWQQAKRPKEGLYRGWQLSEALEFEGLSPIEKEFLEASKRDVERELLEATERAERAVAVAEQEAANAAQNAAIAENERRVSRQTRRVLISVISVSLVVGIGAFSMLMYALSQAATAKEEAVAANYEMATAKEEAEAAQAEVARAQADALAARADAFAASAKAAAAATEVKKDEARSARAKADTASIVVLAQDSIIELIKKKNIGLGGKRILIYHYHVDEASGERVQMLSELLDRSKVARSVSYMPRKLSASLKNPDAAHVRWYRESEREAAETLAVLFASWFQIKVEARDSSGTPEARTAMRGLVEVFLPTDIPASVGEPSEAKNWVQVQLRATAEDAVAWSTNKTPQPGMQYLVLRWQGIHVVLLGPFASRADAERYVEVRRERGQEMLVRQLNLFCPTYVALPSGVRQCIL